MSDGIVSALRRKKVGVLYGGWSAERSISLKSGAAVLAALKRMKIPHVGIDVTPRIAEQVRRAKVDLVFLAVHGPYGEDGRLQGLLDILGIPYTGSGARASAVAMHKPSAKRLFQTAGLPTPEWFVLRKGETPRTPSFKHPWVVKPASQGSAIGVHVVRRASEWVPALRSAFKLEDEILAERFIEGTEVTVGVLDRRPLPVIEIVPKHDFYDFYSKYAKGGSRHLIPARISDGTAQAVSELAVAAYGVLGCRHMARVDIMVSKSGAPFILEANTLPGLTDVSLFPDAARAAGMGFDELIAELLFLAMSEGKK